MSNKIGGNFICNETYQRARTAHVVNEPFPTRLGAYSRDAVGKP